MNISECSKKPYSLASTKWKTDREEKNDLATFNFTIKVSGRWDEYQCQNLIKNIFLDWERLLENTTKEILYGVISAAVTVLGGRWVVAIPADWAAAEEDVLENTRPTHNQLVAWNWGEHSKKT